jgi:hypothetical protein
MFDEDQGATPEEIAPIEVEKSMDDTIRDTLRSMQDRGVTTDADNAESTTDAPLDDAEKAQRIRDEQGKFAAKPEVAEAPAIGAPVIDAPVSTAPNTWKKEAADAWIKADPVIRAEVERREADFHKGIEQYKQAANYAQTMERAITPYAQTLQQLGISPDRAVGELMAADHKLRYGSPQEKSAYFAQLAQSYGIDLAGVQPQEQQYIDPNVSHLQTQVNQLQGYIQNQQMMGQQQAQETLNSEISAFAADPSHSHFDAVRGHMSALLQAGQAKDLSDAYEQAIYANPTTRAAVLQQQANAQREEATKKAQAAKQAASVNVRSRPSMPVSQPIGTMDDTIRATLRRLQSA